jgi:hypothetical protein
MAFKNFSNGVMTAQGEALLKPDKLALMQQDELLAGYAKRIERDTRIIREININEGAQSEQIVELIQTTTLLDADNDGLLGAFDDAALAIIKLCVDDTLRASITGAHSKVMSSGRDVLVLGPYSGAAGEASRIEARMTPDDWAALKRAKLGDTTLEATLKRWLVGAKRLTELDNQRAALLNKQDASRVSAGAVATARNQWVRTMNAFVAAVRSSDLSQQDQDTLLSALTQAEQRADEAARARA